MSHVQVYDPAMCCSTGVCGPQVDPVLPRFAADLDWLRESGHVVERFNLAQDAEAFATQQTVQQMLAEQGVECLPLILVDGRVVSQGDYPSRANLALWTRTPQPAKSMSLPTADKSGPENGGCCGGTDCC